MNIFFLARIVISIKPSSDSHDIPIGFERLCVDLQLDLGQTSHHTYFHTLLNIDKNIDKNPSNKTGLKMTSKCLFEEPRNDL